MIWRRLLFIPPVALALFVVVVLMRDNPKDETVKLLDDATAVRAITLVPSNFNPSATGFGRAAAERTWQAIAQVSGRVIKLAPELSVGTRVASGSELIVIDPRDYEIARDKAEANLASARLSLSEHETDTANVLALLEIEKRVLEVAQEDYDRQKKLRETGSVSRSTLDDAERQLLSQQRVVRELENKLRLHPVQKESLETTLKTREVELEEAQRSLDNTIITAPFKGRVSEKSAAKTQFVREGDSLLTLEDVSSVEILAEFQPSALRNIIKMQGEEKLLELISLTGQSEALAFLLGIGLSAEVIVDLNDERFVWDAEILRFTGSVDPDTGTVSIALRVRNPEEPEIITRRPPLAPGAFVEVNISTPEQPLLLVPRTAVHHNQGLTSKPFVYVIDEQSRLSRVDVTTGPVFDGMTVITEGLQAGASVVLSSLDPAIVGMKLVNIDQAKSANGDVSK